MLNLPSNPEFKSPQVFHSPRFLFPNSKTRTATGTNHDSEMQNERAGGGSVCGKRTFGDFSSNKNYEHNDIDKSYQKFSC
jgi:hypothetical protein